MKKFLSAVLAGALALSLTACGGKAEEKTEYAPDLAKALLGTEGVFVSRLEEIDRETACALYGIDESTVTSCAVYLANAISAEELAAFTFADEAGAEAGLRQLGYRIKDRAEELESYLPGELPKLEKARAERRGNSVLLVVASDYGPVEKLLDK